MFILTNVGQQCPLWRFIHHLPHYTKFASWKSCKHAVSITETLLRADCFWLGISLKGFLGQLLQRHFDFCPLLRRTSAKLSRKYPHPQTPAISRGRIRGKANITGLGVWLSQSLTFGSLASEFQDHRIWSYLAVAKPRLWKLGSYLWRERYMSGVQHHMVNWTSEPNRNSLVAFSGRTPGGRGW